MEYDKFKLKRREKITTGFFLFGALIIFSTSVHYFQTMITGIVEGKTMKDEIWYNVILRVHIVCGLIAIFLGPFQFVESLRNRRLDLHRKLGYVYAVCVFVSALAGLVIAQFAIGGMISTLGFSCLSSLWLITIILSITSIRDKKVIQHRKWMIINYSLTFSAIPQRIMLALALIPDLSFVNVYRMSAWASWILNIIIALYIINRKPSQAK